MGVEGESPTPESFFAGHPDGLAVYRAVHDVVTTLGGASVRVTKSQIALRRRKSFAYVWRPGQYVRNPAAAVLSVVTPQKIASDRIKSVVHPSPKVWLHHLELDRPEQVDDEVRGWLAAAYAAAE